MAIGSNINPMTGAPVDQLGGNAQSLSGQYGSTMGQAYGVQMPLYYDAMEMIPPAWVATTWNMGRVRNTILDNKSFTKFNRGAGGLRQTLSPARFRSLADVSNIDPEFFGTTRKSRHFPFLRGDVIDGKRVRRGYTPFNFLSDVGNRLAASDKVGKFKVAEGTRAFAPGTFGTMTTMASIASGSFNAEATGKVLGSISRFTQASGVTGSPFLSISNLAGQMSGAPKQRLLSSGLGAARFSQVKYAGQVAGYFEGAQAARTGTQAAAKLGVSSVAGEGGYFGKALQSGITQFAEGSKLARFAGSRSAALGLKAVPFIGNAMLTYDIAKFFGKAAGRGLKLGFEGVKSAQGDLTKRGPFGMGYVDNSVAATSRQRGVMAISNSRLNARSFLGQEASFVHQNFG